MAKNTFRPDWAKLDALVEEILKDSPSETRLQALMVEAGMEYEPDSVGRMTKVLDVLNGRRPQRREDERDL